MWEVLGIIDRADVAHAVKLQPLLTLDHAYTEGIEQKDST